MDEKQRLRAELRIQRREHVAALPAAMHNLVFLRPPGPVAALVPAGATVGLYHAIDAEAPAAAYARWFWENGRQIALPWFADRSAPMEFRRWDNPFADDQLEADPSARSNRGLVRSRLSPMWCSCPCWVSPQQATGWGKVKAIMIAG